MNQLNENRMVICRWPIPLRIISQCIMLMRLLLQAELLVPLQASAPVPIARAPSPLSPLCCLCGSWTACPRDRGNLHSWLVWQTGMCVVWPKEVCARVSVLCHGYAIAAQLCQFFPFWVTSTWFTAPCGGLQLPDAHPDTNTPAQVPHVVAIHLLT